MALEPDNGLMTVRTRRLVLWAVLCLVGLALAAIGFSVGGRWVGQFDRQRQAVENLARFGIQVDMRPNMLDRLKRFVTGWPWVVTDPGLPQTRTCTH